MSPAKRGTFAPELFAYLRDLKKNNDRDWFLAYKDRYEMAVKEPSLQFIADFEPHLRTISKEFLAIPKAVGGSLFRIQRDIRFSKDKSPYKTHVGIRFLHKDAKNVHAPVFYLHLEPKGSFAGFGVWHPEPPTLARIRQRIVDDPKGYKKVVDAAAFKRRFTRDGDALSRPPRGFDPDHPLIEELKRKDHVGACQLAEKDIVAPGFDKRLAEIFKAGSSYQRFLCKALGVPF